MNTFARFCGVLLVALWSVTAIPADPPPQVASTQTFAAEKFVVPDQRIVGAESVIPLGELVDLGLTPLKQAPQYLVEARYTWKVFDTATGKEVRLREYESGIFFGAGIKPRQLKAVCAASYLYVARGDASVEAADRTVLLVADVSIGNPAPAPGPDPVPQPTPTPAPALPDGKFGLAKAVYDLATTKVTDAAARTKGAAAIATAYEGVASAISAGTIKTLEDGLKLAHDRNVAALKDAGVAAGTWDDFGASLKKTLYQAYKDKKLNTLGDLATALREVAAGLKAVQ